MIIIFLIFIIIFLFNTKFNFKRFNKKYLEKENTTRINGFFVLMVLFNHFNQYVQKRNLFDNIYYIINSKIGQLMVTTFLFFSGYGIFESIKKNDQYINHFIKKRMMPTFINFAIAIVIFILLNITIHKVYPIKTILLSFTGWDSIGNSNWYMMSIFILYIFTLISFKVFKDNKKSIICLTVLTILYMFIISSVKESYWYNTILCYPFGFIYSFNKEKIDKYVMKDNKHYIISLFIILLASIITLLGLHYINVTHLYNILAILFLSIIILITMKFEYKSKIFNYLGQSVFWIYILQRIPMILFQNRISNNYIYFSVVCTITLILSEVMYRVTTKMWKQAKK